MNSPAPSASRSMSDGAWAWSPSHPAVLLGDLCPRRSARTLKRVAACSKSSRPFEATCTKKIMPIIKKKGKFFEAEMMVRDCDDVNQYGVVNDTMYACYIEKAREEMFASFGCCMSSIARTGRAMAVYEFDFKYFAPLKVRM
ncbi:hypothetical protein EJB05_20475 [Eragrostis curvula]|uniref:Thioesterase domain-containing protein n=1 Tax=Eragrostis curvula TaxID=38414 RepID=A0A5J9V0Q0_9POAL|nr:hypothetical protein EJB05_20475 [Eragrostis curvula]